MPKGFANPRSRGPYSTQACSICRAKKTKCDGVKPVCGSCVDCGRDDECSWGRDSTKKPRTEAHFESLRKRLDTLQTYVDLLERRLAKCICQDISSHLQFRPDEQSEEGGSDILNSDEEITQELTVPTQRLKLADIDPLLHGAIFSSAPSKPAKIPEVFENPTASYVLQVDGVDISQSHPDIDWSRHLPPEVAMDRREHDQILERGSKLHNVFLPPVFFRDMYRALSVPQSEEPPATPHYSPMLHNAILAVSATLSDNAYLRDVKTRQYFVQKAQACFDFKKPDHSMVHAMEYIGMFYTDCGDQVPAELYFAMGSRLCWILDPGVNATQQVEAGLITHDEMVGRNWAYWSRFSMVSASYSSFHTNTGPQDVLLALFWGKDFPQPRNTPMPFVDSVMDQIPWYYAPAKLPPQGNYQTLVLFEMSALITIACQIADVINQLRRSTRPNVTKVAEHVTKIDLELNNWKSRLPEPLEITLVNRDSSTAHRLMLHLGYWWCFITLHRPFFNRRMQPIQKSDPQVDHVKLCIRAAENVLELVETWSSLYSMRLASFKVSGMVFSAATVFFLRALQATGSSRTAHGVLNMALAQVETCIRYMREMGETWASAKRSGDMLQTALDQRLKPIIARRLAQRGELIPTANPIANSPPISAPQQASVSALQPPPISIPHQPPMSAPQEPVLAPLESAPFYTPSYAPEWDSQADPAGDWSELLFDFNFFLEMQSTSAAVDVELSYPIRSESAFPEVFQNFDFRAPEQDLYDESRWKNSVLPIV
ncbi:hypothetical protein K438DRAFT_1925784 [Mycena galopus ATCC 62051]|nr:hypothetical protein K438DRAFT_1925784 [Mycena galopus ATCC 62051]